MKVTFKIFSLFFFVIGILFLYFNPNNALNKLLFFISLALAVGISLLTQKKYYKGLNRKQNVSLLTVIVSLGLASTCMSIFYGSKYPSITTIIFTLFVISVLSYILVRKKW